MVNKIFLVGLKQVLELDYPWSDPKSDDITFLKEIVNLTS